MSKYVGLVLECTRRDGGDLETFICADYEPSSRQYTMIPTAGRICRQYLVVLDAGGWKVRGTRGDLPLIKRTIEKLESFVRISNADPMALPSSCSVAGKNIALLQRLVKQQDQTTFDRCGDVCEKGCPEKSPPDRATEFRGLIEQGKRIVLLKTILERAKLCGKLVFVEFPIDDPDRDHSGEYIVIEHTPDRLYCVATSDAVSALTIAQIRIGSDDPNEPVATVVRSYEDQAYIDGFICKLEELSQDETSDRVARDRAENTAAQVRRVMKRVYPLTSSHLFGGFSTEGAQTGRSKSIHELLREHAPEASFLRNDPFACDDFYRPSDAALPL